MGLAAVVSAEGRAARVALPHMEEVFIRAAGCEAAVLTHEDLGTSLSIGVLLKNAMNFPHVRLQGASLREGFFTQFTLVRTNTCSRWRLYSSTCLSRSTLTFVFLLVKISFRVTAQ